MIDGGKDRLLVEALLHQLPEGRVDDGEEVLLILRIRTLRTDRKIRLADTILEAAEDIISDTSLDEGLLERRAR